MNQREFHCTYCTGKIMIPADLPPTTAPCPHCNEVITSPEIDLLIPPLQSPPAQAVEMEETPPAEMPPTPVAAENEILPQSALPSPTEPAAAPKKSNPKATQQPRRGLFVAMLILLALCLLGLAAFYNSASETNQKIPPHTVQRPPVQPKTDPANSIKIGWQKEAYQLLSDYMAATRAKDKTPFILNGSELTTKLEEFYSSGLRHDSDAPADAFSVYKLSEEDHKRGLFMMIYDQAPQPKTKKLLRPPASLETPDRHKDADLAPANDKSAMESRRIFAFFKRTPDGLKLDWEIFAQTKYRTLQNFLSLPKIGQSGVFRLLIVEVAPEKDRAAAGTRTYRVADPANTSDTARINVKENSEMGRALSSINWSGTKENRPITHTATLELKWGGELTAPALEISRFVCWEFLGLGGSQSSAPAPTK